MNFCIENETVFINEQYLSSSYRNVQNLFNNSLKCLINQQNYIAIEL